MQNLRNLIILVAFTIPTMAMAHPGGNWNRGWCGSMGYHHGGGWMMLLFCLVVLFLVIVAVRWLFNRKNQRAAGAVQVLEERYARGEIDEQEFKQKREVLKK